MLPRKSLKMHPQATRPSAAIAALVQPKRGEHQTTSLITWALMVNRDFTLFQNGKLGDNPHAYLYMFLVIMEAYLVSTSFVKGVCFILYLRFICL